MPTYTYRCEACERIWDQTTSVKDRDGVVCSCGSDKVRRLISKQTMRVWRDGTAPWETSR